MSSTKATPLPASYASSADGLQFKTQRHTKQLAALWTCAAQRAQVFFFRPRTESAARDRTSFFFDNKFNSRNLACCPCVSL